MFSADSSGLQVTAGTAALTNATITGASSAAVAMGAGSLTLTNDTITACTTSGSTGTPPAR